MNTHSSRSHFTSLPSLAELQKIMAREQYRPVPSEKETTHYVKFSAAIKLFEIFNLPTIYFTKDWTWDDLEEKDLIGQVNEIGNQFLEKALANTDHLPIFDEAYDYLAEEDQPQQADLIFVFGAKTPARIEKAIELYRQGLAPKIMLSGGNPFYGPEDRSEAEKYHDVAIQHGVQSTDIIMETNSITLPDNVRTSLNQLEREKFPLHKLLLVNSPYSQRRGYCVFQKYTAQPINILRVNCDTAETYSRKQWFKHPDGIKVVFNELVKLKLARVLNTV